MKYEITTWPVIFGAVLLLAFVGAVILGGVALVEAQYPFLPKGEILPDMARGPLPVAVFIFALSIIFRVRAQ